MECRTVGTLLQPWKLDLSEFESLASMAQRSRIIGVGEGAHFVSEFDEFNLQVHHLEQG
jgi:erythromycin esterase